jgi:thiol-disulfide isomerase/thioredoxin
MRIQPLKSWLIFAAGFVCCFVSVIALLFSAYYFGVKYIHLEAPDFPTQQPAEFDFAAVGKNATSLNFADYRGRVVVLNIWETSCMPCMAELPSFGKLAAHYSGDRDVAVICLSQESADTIFKSRGALNSQAPIFSLNGHPLPSIYKTKGIPATFVIDERGMIVFKHIGSSDWSHPSVIKFIDSLKQMPNKFLKPTTVGAVRSAIAVRAVVGGGSAFFVRRIQRQQLMH